MSSNNPNDALPWHRIHPDDLKRARGVYNGPSNAIDRGLDRGWQMIFGDYERLYMPEER